MVRFAGADHLSSLHVRILQTHIYGLQRFYADAPPGKLAGVINSDSWLELFCNEGRASDLAKAVIADRVEVSLPK